MARRGGPRIPRFAYLFALANAPLARGRRAGVLAPGRGTGYPPPKRRPYEGPETLRGVLRGRESEARGRGR